MKTLLLIIGILAVLMGALWAGQGSGAVPYPANSFMINNAVWIYYGAALAAFGVVLIVLSRRRG